VGINAGRVEIEPDGKIVVIAEGNAADMSGDALDQWMAKSAGSA
jgi:hypothetical protein